MATVVPRTPTIAPGVSRRIESGASLAILPETYTAMPRTKLRTRPSRPSAGVKRKLLRRTSLPGSERDARVVFQRDAKPSVAAGAEAVGFEDLLADCGRHAVAAPDDEDLTRRQLDPPRRRRLLRERRPCQYCQRTHTDPASSIHHDDLQLPGVHESADNVAKGSTPRYVGRISGASAGPWTALGVRAGPAPTRS